MCLIDNRYQLSGYFAYIYIKSADTYYVIFKTYKK
ncbi:Uncharacterized protein BC05F1_01217 [Bacillus wiedmannii]|uniref:Uncharacterized protein n=1 Tax=Bacillus wiedmannii TaxID=1890302 RepID=A0A1C4BBP4_9BACI|nr:Uncharacterized protein BC05F1_01217 [Bacillus wiedmannii]